MAKDYKKDFGYSYCFGVYPSLELLKSRPELVLNLFVSPSGLKNRGVEEIFQIAKDRKIPIEQNVGMVEKLSGQNNIYAMASFKKYTQNILPNQNHVVLVNPSDMGNLGTIIRTMLGFGITNLAIIKPGVDIFDPKVIRASMGAIFKLNWDYFGTFEEYFGQNKTNKIYTFLTNGGLELQTTNFDQPYSLVFGPESSGLPEAFGKIGTGVRIDHSPTIDSLALPIAVGIVLYQAFASSPVHG